MRNPIRAGVPERVAMQISGHETRSVFDRYDIVSERDLREAAQRLDNYLGQIRKDRFGHTLGTPAYPDDRPSERRTRKSLN